ncbi:hypothetical protein CK203_107134 [Vitis vinifera]|uniref:Reverse transcriptase domain-containing protein n=1 Tax=Vitis vinifera TaxID=29760 RepID=A0A438CVK7_VITVI|nr:hypothetical protein CK203_107134 [Vitis vinifera]
MEEEAKPIRQLQRRLNPHLQEVVRAEVLKLLQAVLFTHIDSPWVVLLKWYQRSQDYCGPERKREEIATRLTSGYFQIEIDVEDQEKTTLHVFMDDITVYGGTYEECLVNLEAVLHRCIERLVLNWEKCHFMVRQGIVLGHIISEKALEVDKAKVELIVKLPSPNNCEMRAVLGQREDGKPYVIYYASKHE